MFNDVLLVNTQEVEHKSLLQMVNRISRCGFFLEHVPMHKRSTARPTRPIDWERMYRRRAYAARRAVIAIDRAVRLTSTGPAKERDQALCWMRLWLAFAYSRHG